MEIDDELEDIKRLDEIIDAEANVIQESTYFGFVGSDSSDDSDDEDVESSETFPEEDDDSNISIEKPNNLATLETNKLSEFAYLIPHLTTEEFTIISKCKDLELKNLLILNRAKSLQLKQLQEKLYYLLQQCNNNLKYQYTRRNRKKRMVEKFNVSIVGAPYFRDSELFPYPANADIIEKRNNGEINICYLPKRKVWSCNTQINLKSRIMTNYFTNILDKYQKDLEKLPKKKENETVRYIIEQKIINWKDSYDNMDPPKLWDDSMIDWNIVAAQQFNDSSYAFACRAFWNLYLHPNINKAPFTKPELINLDKLVEINNTQNWDLIAEELQNRRSPYQLCMHYFQKQHTRFHMGKFSFKEDSVLLDLVKKNRLGDDICYPAIAAQMPNRSREQIYHRVRRLLCTNVTKVGKFSENEDLLLMCLIKKYGENYDIIQRHMKHRNKEQMMTRYQNYLKMTNLKLGGWTVEEDRIIMDYVSKNGSQNWRFLENTISRNKTHIRHRYSTLQAHFASNPGITLEEMPRRGVHIVKGLSIEEINKKAETLVKNNELPKLELSDMVSNNQLKIVGRPVRNEIDNQLIDYFRPTSRVKKYRVSRVISDEMMKTCAKSVQMVLNLLSVNLDIPDDVEMQQYPNLDATDKQVLAMLRSNEASTSSTPTADVPPNVNTVQALRCMLLQHQQNRNRIKKAIKQEVEDDEVMRNLKLFEERFASLFMWPYLMSITELPEKLEASNQHIEDIRQNEREEEKKRETGKKGRKRKVTTRILKMNEARLNKKKAQEAVRVRAEVTNFNNVNFVKIEPIQDENEYIDESMEVDPPEDPLDHKLPHESNVSLFNTATPTLVSRIRHTIRKKSEKGTCSIDLPNVSEEVAQSRVNIALPDMPQISEAPLFSGPQSDPPEKCNSPRQGVSYQQKKLLFVKKVDGTHQIPKNAKVIKLNQEEVNRLLQRSAKGLQYVKKIIVDSSEVPNTDESICHVKVEDLRCVKKRKAVAVKKTSVVEQCAVENLQVNKSGTVGKTYASKVKKASGETATSNSFEETVKKIKIEDDT